MDAVPVSGVENEPFSPCPSLVHVPLDLLAHKAARLIRALLPGEDAGRHDAVEADRGEGSEERVPVHLALADVHVLVDRHLRAGRIADVAEAGRGLVVVGVGDMDMRQRRGVVANHLRNVVAEIEGVRRAIEEPHVLGADHADHVDRRMQRLAPVLGMGLDVELDSFSFERRNQLLHRAPPGGLARLGRILSAAAVGRVAAIGRRATAELRIHRVDAHLDRDFDCLLPGAHGGLAFVLVRACPAVHREQRGDLHPMVLEGFLEARDPLGIRARVNPPGKEVVARRKLDPLVAELGDLARQLFQRQMPVHVRIERNPHRRPPFTVQ
jgi:hypothetical protein